MNFQYGPNSSLFPPDMSMEAELHPLLELSIRNKTKCPYASFNENKSGIDHYIGTLRLTLNERLVINDMINKKSETSLYTDFKVVEKLNSANTDIMKTLFTLLETRLKLHGVNLIDIKKINFTNQFNIPTDYDSKATRNFIAPFSEKGMFPMSLGNHYWLYLNFTLVLLFIKLAELNFNASTISSCLAYLRLAELLLWTNDYWGIEKCDQTFVYLRYFIRLYGCAAMKNLKNHQISLCRCIRDYHAINNEFERKVCMLLMPSFGTKYKSSDGEIQVDVALSNPIYKFFPRPYFGFFNESSKSLVESKGTTNSFNVASYVRNVLCNGDLLEWDKYLIEDLVLLMYSIEKSECPLVHNSLNFCQDYFNTLNTVHYICTFVKNSNYKEKVFYHVQKYYLLLVYHYMKKSPFADRYDFYCCFNDEASLEDEDNNESLDVIDMRHLIYMEYLNSTLLLENTKKIELQNEESYQSLKEYLDNLESLKSRSTLAGNPSSIVATPLIAMKEFVFKFPMKKKQRLKLQERFFKIEDDFYKLISKSSKAVLNASLILIKSVDISKFKSSYDESCTNMYQIRLFRLLYISDIIQVYQGSNVLRSRNSRSVSRRLGDQSQDTPSDSPPRDDSEKNVAENRDCDHLATLRPNSKERTSSEGGVSKGTEPQISQHEILAQQFSNNKSMESGLMYFFNWDELWLQDIMRRVYGHLSTSMKTNLVEATAEKEQLFEQIVERLSRSCGCVDYEVLENTLSNDGLKKTLISIIMIIMDSIRNRAQKSARIIQKLSLLDTYPGASNTNRLQEALDLVKRIEKNLEGNFLQPEGMSRMRKYLDDIKEVLMKP